eukprot:COSAG01_NODE_22535_length_851_cov_1.611702_2_plen_30_part_01
MHWLLWYGGVMTTITLTVTTTMTTARCHQL